MTKATGGCLWVRSPHDRQLISSRWFALVLGPPQGRSEQYEESMPTNCCVQLMIVMAAETKGLGKNNPRR